jgi:hypothetical protein
MSGATPKHCRPGDGRSKPCGWRIVIFASLARLKMPSGANAFEIGDIQEGETEV